MSTSASISLYELLFSSFLLFRSYFFSILFFVSIIFLLPSLYFFFYPSFSTFFLSLSFILFLLSLMVFLDPASLFYRTFTSPLLVPPSFLKVIDFFTSFPFSAFYFSLPSSPLLLIFGLNSSDSSIYDKELFFFIAFFYLSFSLSLPISFSCFCTSLL